MNRAVSSRPKIYIGCALTQAPPAFRQEVESLKRHLAQSYEVFDFVGLEKGTPADVYRWDIRRCVAECDLFVAVCDYPAIGLGYELGVAVEHYRKPVLAVAKRGVQVTRLIGGIDAPNYALQRYDRLLEVAEMARRKLATLTA